MDKLFVHNINIYPLVNLALNLNVACNSNIIFFKLIQLNFNFFFALHKTDKHQA